jgi:hypothetical protein
VRWDLMMVVCLFFTALVTPFEVAFLSKGRWQDPLSLINRLVDLGFFLDMVLNFFLSYKSDDGHKMVYDHQVIRKRYLHGWFFLDFVSMLPVDLLAYIDWLSPHYQKSMRLMRLIKLLRLVRARSPPARLRTAYSVPATGCCCASQYDADRAHRGLDRRGARGG